MNAILNVYNTPALIVLALTSLLWGGSHIFLVMGLKELDFSSRILGFIGFLSLLFISGLKGWLISIPIIMACSFFGAWEAKRLREKLEKKK